MLFLKPTLDDEIQDSINEILDYYENGYEIKEIEQIASKRLINICNNDTEAIFYPSLQRFFEDYLKKQELSMDINCVMQMHIRYIMQNLELKAWFYESLFPILVNQVKSSEIDYRVRNTRVAFLWEIFRLDESKRDEILSIFINILENECKSQDGEICKFICSSYQRIPINLPTL